MPAEIPPVLPCGLSAPHSRRDSACKSCILSHFDSLKASRSCAAATHILDGPDCLAFDIFTIACKHSKPQISKYSILTLLHKYLYSYTRFTFFSQNPKCPHCKCFKLFFSGITITGAIKLTALKSCL